MANQRTKLCKWLDQHWNVTHKKLSYVLEKVCLVQYDSRTGLPRTEHKQSKLCGRSKLNSVLSQPFTESLEPFRKAFWEGFRRAQRSMGVSLLQDMFSLAIYATTSERYTTGHTSRACL